MRRQRPDYVSAAARLDSVSAADATRETDPRADKITRTRAVDWARGCTGRTTLEPVTDACAASLLFLKSTKEHDARSVKTYHRIEI